MSRSDLAAWYALASTKGLGSARLLPLARSLNKRGDSAASLIGAASADLEASGLGATLAGRAADALADPLEPPEAPEGAVLLHPDDERYPLTRALHGAPPLPALLYVAGNVQLVGRTPSLAIVGSRHASPMVLEASARSAAAITQSGWVVVSGLAKGVDEAAHRGAVEGGGETVAVLAEGLLRSERAWQILHAPTGDVAVVSEFGLTDDWTPGRAMTRNGTVAGLSDMVLVVASGERGGTWEMGQLCIRYDKPLLVVDFGVEEAAGNRRMIRAGGTPIDPIKLEASLEEHLVLPAVDDEYEEPTLFDP